MKHDYGFSKVVNEDGVLQYVAVSIQNEAEKTRLAALQIVALAAAEKRTGAFAALDAVHFLSCVARERMRFETLVQQLSALGCSEEYKLAALTLISNLLNSCPDLNMVVYLQMDLERAGFNTVLDRLDENHPLMGRMIANYKARLVNVDHVVATRDENFELYQQASEQVNGMQQTLDSVTRQRDELRVLHKEANVKAGELEETVQGLHKEQDALGSELKALQKEVEEKEELITEARQQIQQLEEQVVKATAAAAAGGPSKIKGKGKEAKPPRPDEPPPPPPPPGSSVC